MSQSKATHHLRAVPARAAQSAPASLRDQAYERIKRRIITLEYRPGGYLNAAGISEDLKLGFTPVSQALARLELEGMIEIIPRKGAIVRSVSMDEVLQIIDVRLVNETRCAELAAQRASAADLGELEAILGRAAPLVRARNVEGLMQLDREFHIVLSRAAGNPVLAEILLGLHERSLRFWFISLSDRDHLAAVQREHRAVLQALRSRDARAAAAAMRAHIESFRATIARSAQD